MVQRKARNRMYRRDGREIKSEVGGGMGNSHTTGEGSISKLMLKAEEITTSLLVDGNIKEALDL